MRIRPILPVIAMIATPACHAKRPATRLTNARATTAMQALMGMHRFQVVLGTCKPAVHAELAGQTACTLLTVSPGATSETQADFHWNGSQWVAAPSGSQSVLPFPDPVLMGFHSWTRIDPNAGPIR